MNIRQAKARFTELTGLTASSDSLYYHALRLDWLARGLHYVADNCDTWTIDCRYKQFWLLLNEYIENYADIKEVV